MNLKDYLKNIYNEIPIDIATPSIHKDPETGKSVLASAGKNPVVVIYKGSATAGGIQMAQIEVPRDDILQGKNDGELINSLTLKQDYLKAILLRAAQKNPQMSQLITTDIIKEFVAANPNGINFNNQVIELELQKKQKVVPGTPEYQLVKRVEIT